MSTATNAPAGIGFSWSSSAVRPARVDRALEVPVAAVVGDDRARSASSRGGSTFASSLNRASVEPTLQPEPRAHRRAPAVATIPAWCRAGHSSAVRCSPTVNRIAWSTSPACTSSHRSEARRRSAAPRRRRSSNRAGRRAFEPRSKIAPLAAPSGSRRSTRRRTARRACMSLWSTISACRSEPPSTVMSGPNGYGPGSLSLA